MDTVERFDKERQSNSSIYKIFTTKGFKRALVLILLISFFNIIYVIFYKLSENNLNTLFTNFVSKLQGISDSNVNMKL